MSTIVPIYKKDNKTDCTNDRSISLLTTTYKILSNFLLSRLTRNAKKMTGGHQTGFLHNRSTTDHIFYIRKCLRKNGNKGSSASANYILQDSLLK
jgi:hypothetical protein